jgi:hypothetical protein
VRRAPEHSVPFRPAFFATRPSLEIRPVGRTWSSGGRSWWAHFAFTRINIELTILEKKIEELMNVRGIGEKNFLKLKPQLAVGQAKADHEPQAK